MLNRKCEKLIENFKEMLLKFEFFFGKEKKMFSIIFGHNLEWKFFTPRCIPGWEDSVILKMGNFRKFNSCSNNLIAVRMEHGIVPKSNSKFQFHCVTFGIDTCEFTHTFFEIAQKVYLVKKCWDHPSNDKKNW